jgi:hypothetical protein
VYVRWKRRARRSGTLLSAYVVESRRLAGKPRQTILAYLGSIRQDQVDQIGRRLDFWATARPRLTTLATDERERVTLELCKVVTPVSSQERAADARHVRALFAAIRSAHKGDTRARFVGTTSEGGATSAAATLLPHERRRR